MVDNAQRIGGAKPLDDESWEALPNLLLSLRIAMTNVAFYPAGSTQVTVSVESAYSNMARILDRNRSLILAESEGRLLANGRAMSEEQVRRTAGVFVQSLSDCNIKSVTFRQGVDLNEIFVFLQGLGEKKWMKEKGVILAQQLEESKIYHIGIDEKIYVPIGDGDLVIERARDILAQSGGKIDDIMKAIDQASEMLGVVEDESSRDKIREEIAKRFLEMDPGTFADMLKRDGGREGGGARDQAIETFSDEKIREIVAELSRTYIRLKQTASPGSEEYLEMERVKEVIKKVLSLSGEGAISVEIYRELVNEGILEDVVKWDDVRAEDDLVARGRKIVECDPSELVSPEAVEEIERVLAELKDRDEDELAAKIVDKIGAGLFSPTADVRLRSAETLGSLSAAISSYGSNTIDEGQLEMLIRAEEKETDPRVYTALGRQLSGLTKRLIHNLDFEKARKGVGMFRKHQKDTGQGFPERSDLALQELKWVADPEIARILMAELKSEERHRREGAQGIVMRLEEVIIRHLMNAIKETEELAHRKYLSSILRELGEEATARLVEELEADMSVTSTIRLMEILDGMERPEISLEQLRRSLSHPHPQVRHEVIGTLKRFGGRDAGIMIARALDDKNFYVLRYAVQAVGDVGYGEALDQLIALGKGKKDLSSEEKDALLEEVCVSLGKILDERAIPFLATVARSRMVAGIFRKGYSRSVRVAAIRALGRFGTAQARSVLELIVKEKDGVIRNAVSSALSS